MRALQIAQVMAAAALLGGCSCSKESPPPGASSAPPAPVTSAAPTLSSAPVSLSAQPVVPPPVDAGPPRRVVRADGISIVETADGQVIFKTTSLWNESLETTYASCEYYRGAVPVLKRQISEERAKLLERVCTGKSK